MDANEGETGSHNAKTDRIPGWVTGAAHWSKKHKSGKRDKASCRHCTEAMSFCIYMQAFVNTQTL